MKLLRAGMLAALGVGAAILGWRYLMTITAPPADDNDYPLFV